MSFPNQSKILSKKNLFIVAVCTTPVFWFINQPAAVIFILMFAVIILFHHPDHFIIFISVLMLLTLVGEINSVLRIIVQIMTYGALLFIFLKRYGASFRDYPLPPRSLGNYIVALVLAMLLSSLFSGYFVLGLIQTFRTLLVFLLFYLLFAIIRTQKEASSSVYAILTASIIMGLSIVYQFFSSDMNLLTIFAITSMRVAGLLSNFNALSVFFAVSIPLLIGSLFFYKSISSKLVITFTLIFFLFSLMLTGSRASLISVIVSAFFIQWFLNRKLLLRSVSVLIMIAFVVFIIPDLYNNISLLFRLGEGLSQRDYLWKISTGMIRDNLITGIGPGTYGIKMYNYFPVPLESYVGKSLIDLSEMTKGANISHSFYLSLFSDLGIPGLLLSIFLPIVFFSIALPVIRNNRSGSRLDYIKAITFCSIGAGMFARGFFEGINIISLGWITADLPFWLIFINIMLLNKNITLK